MRPDDPGILGKLPRERPGRRSDRREEAKATDEPEATPPHGDQLGEAVPRKGAGRRRTPPQATEDEPQAPPHGDPLRDAARVAGAGLKAAGRVASGLLRRLPRP